MSDRTTADGLTLVLAPTVAVLGRQQESFRGIARWVGLAGAPDWRSDGAGAAERLVEIAGRTCYRSFASPRPGGTAAYITHILESGHGSVLEHAVWTLGIAGVSRTCAQELLRHRAGLSPSMESQRYVDASDIAFVVPPLYLPTPPDWWVTTVRAAREAYRETTDVPLESTAARKAVREAARSVLPGAAETRLVLTGNARAWRNVIEQRASAGADAEIRRLAGAILGVLRQESPLLFGDYQVDDEGVVTTPYRKV